MHEIKGKCPNDKFEDNIAIDDPEIVLENTDALCTQALSAILHYTTILWRGLCPVGLGLTTLENLDRAYIQCVDRETIPAGETVIFKWRRISE